MPSPGELLGGKYRLLRRLGRGGMGAVYEAVHEQIGKAVAVKVLLPQAGAEAELIARFQQEAQAAAAAGHRGIVEIFDVGVCDDGSPYLVMELLLGQSLGERVAEAGPLSVAETAYVACQVLSALSAAHEAGIIHRDLKPENILLADSGAPLPEVKLLDFGISRIVAPGAEDFNRMTRTGVVIGTPQYMSPEQAAGKKDIDHQTDLYSMAVILFHCLTGGFPHDGENYNALMASIIADPPRPSRELAPALPAALETIIDKGLEKRREARYESAAEMFYHLRPFVDPAATSSLRAPVKPQGAAMVPTLREAAAPEASGEGEAPTEPFDLSKETPTTAEPLASGGRGRQVEGAGKETSAPRPTEASRQSPRRWGPLLIALLAALIGLGGGLAAMTLLGSESREPSRGSQEVPPAEGGAAAQDAALARSPRDAAPVLGAPPAPGAADASPARDDAGPDAIEAAPTETAPVKVSRPGPGGPPRGKVGPSKRDGGATARPGGYGELLPAPPTKQESSYGEFLDGPPR